MTERRTRKRVCATLCVWFVVVHWTSSCCGFESTLTPWFALEPEDTVAMNHSSVVLHCIAANSTNGSNVEISWRRNGQALVPDGRQYILSPNGSLLIPHFSQQPNYTEMYECIIAKSESGALVSRRAWLQVAVLGNFSGHPQGLVVREGENARFECTISGVPFPKVIWIKNGQTLRQSERFKELPSHVLQIVNVSTSDAGNYFCQASNAFGHQRMSSIAHLTVHFGSRFKAIELLAGPKDLEVEIGNTATFECFPSHGHASIIWKRKGGVPLPKGRIRISNSGNLEIREIKMSDAGSYACEVDGTPEPFREAMLSVIEPPELLPSHQDSHSHGRAHRASLRCEFNGVPRPVITWTKNTEPMRSYGRIIVHGNELQITQLRDSDSALYQCWAENHAGRAGTVVQLTVTRLGIGEDPEPPTNVRARVINSKTIEITWQPSPSIVVGYSIHYCPTLDGMEGQEVRQGLFSINLTMLQPNTNYTFYVRAYNSKGASEPTANVFETTEEDVPIGMPDSRVLPLNATSLRVSWRELPSFLARGVIIYYTILYKQKGVEKSDNITVPSDVLTYILTGLLTDETYSICVRAATKAGQPKEEDCKWLSQVVKENLIDDESEVPSANENMTISNVTIRTLDATTVYMEWEYPKYPAAKLIGVVIRYGLTGEEKKHIALVHPKANHTIHDLVPDTVYEFIIAALMGDESATDESATDEFATDEFATDESEGELFHETLRTPISPVTPPPPPVISEVMPVNETAIHFSWLSPPYPVTYYSISCVAAAVETGKRPQEKFFNSTSTHLVISGLKPFTEYHFTVRSHNSAGAGPLSSVVSCRTEASPPPGILELTYLLWEPTVVQLNWKMPPNANDIVSQYVVSYCEDRFAADHPWHIHIENGSLCYTVLRDLKSRTTYQVRMHAENTRGAGPASSIKVLTGILSDSEYSSSSDRMMGIIIGIGISGGCIVICVIIILLRNRCSPPPRGGPPHAMQHSNGYTTPLRHNGFVTGTMDDKHGTNFHEPDGTTPMLNHPQESDNIENKTQKLSPKSKPLHMWRSVDSRKSGSTDKSTTIV